MSAGVLSYRGRADLTLVYGEAPGLSRTFERPGVEVVVTRHSATAPVSVLLDRQLGAALLLGPAISRAALALADGTALSGPVQEIAASGDYFEIAAVSQASQGSGRE
ncbi:hypothetical protein [Pseudomonas sp. Hg5Tf]|uniref:Uncharacterized protein n=1 Tax=Pseudomonas sp. Hg7Tf TaxID=3236988 RepID=A0AB39HT43_9PSED|nr:hypothetical protein [Pseudomonas sp. Hg5Tf]MDH2562270.1 hypothetical protein [Pseudomonas sp. Hg5Tf]